MTPNVCRGIVKAHTSSSFMLVEKRMRVKDVRFIFTLALPTPHPSAIHPTFSFFICLERYRVYMKTCILHSNCGHAKKNVELVE